MKTDLAPARHFLTGRPTPTRTGPALAALALGGLAIGTTEFASMGLLPQFAADLGATVPQAGSAISAYALGVVVGAPALAIAGARWPRKRLVLVLAAALALTNASSALAPTFETFLATRFLSGLPHGAYFGTAAVLGASLLPRAQRARAVAATMTGLMVANIVGVPLATWLGQALGWPSAYLAVAGIALVTMAAVALLVPDVRDERPQSIRGELSAFGRPQVWLTMLVIAVGYGGTFAVYSYITPILTTLSGFTEAYVPLALALFGVGMTVGNTVGGRLAERWPMRTIAGGMAVASLAMAAFTVTAYSVVGALLTLFVLALATTGTTPALNTRLMDAAPDGPTLGAACHHSAFNIANALGAALGGAVLAAGLGYSAPAAVGAALPLLGLIVLGGSAALERRERRRGPDPVIGSPTPG
ncbi:MFS transporter [Pseudonocardia sp. KRD291]|uniref:MFS transporter n=1 Tax=Pseudonocardia sp. KRD291 TaxID=2792007 RepID=UPI001C49CF8D|nr:MFS transporter [Pseudonocardia sp. KRD291]MBW0106426.1 MFS transporter [Pseudonocardia sp. KRD291]